MDREAQMQMLAMLAECQDMDADIRFHPEYSHMTVLAWEETAVGNEERALSIQRRIQQRIMQYPRLVCYCFDPFSTLVYAV